MTEGKTSSKFDLSLKCDDLEIVFGLRVGHGAGRGKTFLGLYYRLLF